LLLFFGRQCSFAGRDIVNITARRKKPRISPNTPVQQAINHERELLLETLKCQTNTTIVPNQLQTQIKTEKKRKENPPRLLPKYFQ
jgi:hypothetical protein